MAENATEGTAGTEGITTNGSEEISTNIGFVNDNGNELTTGGVPELIDQPQGNEKSGRKKKMYIIIGVTIVIAIIIAIVLGVTLSGNDSETTTTTTTTTSSTTSEPPTDPGPDPEPEPPAPPIIDIDDFLNGTYSGSIPPMTWTAGGDIMFRNDDGDLVKFNVEDGSTENILLQSSAVGELFERSSRFLQLSPDDKKLSFSFDETPIYRHSFVGQYVVYDIENDNFYNIAPATQTKTESPIELQNFVWGPDGSSMAFVYQNNIYYKSSPIAPAKQITTSGIEDVIYNGVPDWVYEEEVFSSNSALWFSKDGDKIAYASFNDNDVKTMYVPNYGEPGNKSYQYTEHHAMRYPKAGTTNPTVSVSLYDLNSDTQFTYTAPTTLTEPILLSATFANNLQLALVWSNRVQNEMMVQLCSGPPQSCIEVFHYEEPLGWIQNNPLIFNEDGTKFITILPENVGGVRYMQVVEVTVSDEDSYLYLSRSNHAHTVRSIYKWTDDNVIWYRATGVEDSAEQHIYNVDSDFTVTCFSCNIKRSNDGECLFNDAVFSKDGNLLVVNCAGPDVPQWFLYDSSGKYIRDWELNEELSSILGPAGPTKKIKMQVPVAEGFPDAEVFLQVPHDYETRENIPLLVYVYAGPNTAAVSHRWSITWETTLVSRYGYAVALIDGRGSGLRNVDNLFAVNRNLGVLDIEDQITVTRYLQNTLSWVDRTRTCIWGWSYGGYASSLALSRGGDVFKCAIAVAPVTDWRFYDTIYTERYMDLPSVNVDGYTQTSLLTDKAVDGFRNKNYLLIHGTADDNVHYQHAMELSYKLQVRNIHFDQMSYTDEDHGLGGVRNHLYNYMEKYLENQLLQPHPPLVITREDFLNGRYSARSPRGTWASESALSFRNDNNDFVLYDVKTDITTILIDHSTEAGELLQRSRSTQLSPQRTHVALAYDAIPVYRHTFLGRYVVYDTQTKELYEVVPSGISESHPPLQNFVWGPQGTSMAFVYQNDIYYKPNAAASAQRITTTGVEDVIYNGIPDWVYEEEVFSSSVAMWFSKNGDKLAYATFDDHEVETMYVPHYGYPGNKSHQYTEHHDMRYPKVGTINPIVTVTLRDLSSTTSVTYLAPTTLDQPILLSVTFVSNDELALVWANRVQNQMIVQLCSEGSTCNQIFAYNEPNGWILNTLPIFNSEGNAFITILPQDVNGIRYKQVVKVSRSGDTWVSESRTNTAHTVKRIIRWTVDDVIWYTATAIDDSANQHIYRVDNDGVICFSCTIKRADNGPCLFNDASMSSDASALLLNCAGPEIPQAFIYTSTGQLVRNWELNEDLFAQLIRRELPKQIRLQVPAAEGYPSAEVVVRVPHNYESLTNIPLLVYVYGGPDTQLVTSRWALDWETSLITRYGIAVAHIDGRGSGLKNIDNLFAINRKLGDVEIEDQISVTKHLQDTFSWLDRSRACIWGWSYGGYASSLALSRGGDVFKCAIAVAPVTDFRFYDTIYTERYMDLPDVNADGYNTASMLNDVDVEGFRNKNYFLIHGTADDNVHYQHAMELSLLLQRKNVDFKQMSYTDEDHGLGGVRPHLYHDMEKYLQEQLQW